MSNFIKLTDVDDDSVTVNASKMQSIFPYDNYAGIMFDGCKDILFVKESYEDILAAIGAVDINDVKSAPDESDTLLCKKYPEPMYTDSEKIEMLEKEVQDLREWLKLAVHDLQHIANTNKLTNFTGVFNIPSRDASYYKWKFLDHVEKYICK